MVQPPSASALSLAVLLPLIGWRVYLRFKRMVGRQRLSRVRPWITLTVFPAIALLLAASARHQPQRLALLAAGLVVGAALGVYGLRKTKFEPTPQGLFYTPNAHLGVALSLLLVARIVYRFVEIYLLAPHVARSSDEFARSPLTLAVFGLLAGYYIAYAVGLVRWRSRVMAAKRQREAAQREAAPLEVPAPEPGGSP
jgi:hypothetical protein